LPCACSREQRPVSACAVAFRLIILASSSPITMAKFHAALVAASIASSGAIRKTIEGSDTKCDEIQNKKKNNLDLCHESTQDNCSLSYTQWVNGCCCASSTYSHCGDEGKYVDVKNYWYFDCNSQVNTETGQKGCLNNDDKAVPKADGSVACCCKDWGKKDKKPDDKSEKDSPDEKPDDKHNAASFASVATSGCVLLLAPLLGPEAV